MYNYNYKNMKYIIISYIEFCILYLLISYTTQISYPYKTHNITK